MQVPLELSFRNVEKTKALEDLIHEKVAKLDKICGHMTSCRVAVEKTQDHVTSGSAFRVRIDMNVPPGHELVVKREPGQGEMHDDISTVIRDAFESAFREAKKLKEKEEGKVKSHEIEEENFALVSKLFEEEGYGFLRTPSNREIYFHRNSVLHGDFDRMEIGTGVRYVEEMGEDGPQATTVQIIDKPGARVSPG